MTSKADHVKAMVELMTGVTEDRLAERALEASTAPPILYAPKAVADEWVLVPRHLLRQMAEWGAQPVNQMDTVKAVLMLAEVVADARLLGVEK